MHPHPTVTRDEWLTARKTLLDSEKEFTRLRDRISAERRALPWVKVEKTYTFDTPEGPKTLSELFDGRSQLVVKHFMLGPGWAEGCLGCSFGADHIDGALVHLEHHDVSYVAVSRAPLPEIEAYRKRMGWHFDWVSSHRSDFNFDYHVSFTEEQRKAPVFYNYRTIETGMDELPGLSVFCKDEAGNIFHTYSSYARGSEELLTTYMVLDLTPKGRDENGPNHNLGDWVKRHDQYADAATAASCCRD